MVASDRRERKPASSRGIAASTGPRSFSEARLDEDAYGAEWVRLGAAGPSGVIDEEWTNHAGGSFPTQFDLTPYKNAAMQIRFGYMAWVPADPWIGAGWSLDDVFVASEICE